MYTLGAILLLAVLLGGVVEVIDSVLELAKVKAIVTKLPVIGAHWALIISILMVWLLKSYPAGGWGLVFENKWENVVVNGAIIYGSIPLKDAVVSMVNKGLRA
ncbi:MAG: hypothetical protein F2681_05495 [Actinobacteria bacterium]|jgi:hypothetical protein|uniref:Unannotated protein n=1 Tax=freshwater metagenome TaxID=449393 RepID=A0A6J7C1I2_9ZZZZ|nr:hypothetical protein [Actinomycetota bacterium]MSW77497.1 hypothetical protein [Actinomycetota bacterium]MSX55656.1 hypothetical protein [Actinomycetota bacterium]MSZ82579.1 hypothetical protein [Actinomycetota bacterium]MTB17793.1 hypothetical protein [Actinomycetota bacterium]